MKTTRSPSSSSPSSSSRNSQSQSLISTSIPGRLSPFVLEDFICIYHHHSHCLSFYKQLFAFLDVLVCQLLDEVAHVGIPSVCAKSDFELTLVVEEYFEAAAWVVLKRQQIRLTPPTQIQL